MFKSFLAWIAIVIGSIGTASGAFAEGAFVVGPLPNNGGYSFGVSQNASTKTEALSIAIQKCQTLSALCEIKFTFEQTCFALATQYVGSHYGVATRSSLQDAIQLALSGCARFGSACRVQLQFCDTVSEQALAEQAERQRQAAAAAEAMRLRQQEQAAREAEQSRIAAEQAAAAAERRRIAAETAARTAEQHATSVAVTQNISAPGFLGEKIPINIITKAAAAFLLLLWAAHVKSRERIPPIVRALIGAIVPLAQSLLFIYLGIGQDITLGEITLLSTPFGVGEIILALVYRPHLA